MWPRCDLCIFGDESSQTKHRYLVLGTTACREAECDLVDRLLMEAANEYGGTSELKWESVKARNLVMYQAVIDTYFALIRSGVLKFYGLVVDTRQIDNKRFNNSDDEVGFNKLFYSLLFKYARRYADHEPRFYVFLDHRNTRHPLEPIRKMLNARAARDCGFEYDPYRVLQFRRSHTEPLIQATDVIIGAVAYQMNGHDLATSAAMHKVMAAQFVADAAGVKTLTRPTPFYGSDGFDLWHYDLSKAKGVPRA